MTGEMRKKLSRVDEEQEEMTWGVLAHTQKVGHPQFKRIVAPAVLAHQSNLESVLEGVFEQWKPAAGGLKECFLIPKISVFQALSSKY